VAPRGERRGIYRIFVGNRKGRVLVEYLGINEGILLKWVLTFRSLKTYIYIYIYRTAVPTSRRYILNIYSTNIRTEYFKHAAKSPFFFLFKMPFIS